MLEWSNADMKKQTWLNLGNDDSISSKVIRTQTEQFLELFSQTLNFFCTLMMWRYHGILLFWLYAAVLMVRSCFDWTHSLIKLFLYMMCVLCLCLFMMSYLVFFHVFLLTTRNHIIFLVQFGINKYLLIFLKNHKLHSPYRLIQFF